MHNWIWFVLPSFVLLESGFLAFIKKLMPHRSYVFYHRPDNCQIKVQQLSVTDTSLLWKIQTLRTWSNKVEQLLLCLTHKWVNDNSSSTACIPNVPYEIYCKNFYPARLCHLQSRLLDCRLHHRRVVQFLLHQTRQSKLPSSLKYSRA